MEWVEFYTKFHQQKVGYNFIRWWAVDGPKVIPGGPHHTVVTTAICHPLLNINIWGRYSIPLNTSVVASNTSSRLGQYLFKRQQMIFIKLITQLHFLMPCSCWRTLLSVYNICLVIYKTIPVYNLLTIQLFYFLLNQNTLQVIESDWSTITWEIQYKNIWNYREAN